MTEQDTMPELSNTEANRIFWDGAATSFYAKLITIPSVVELYKQVSAAVLSRVEFDPRSTVLMDFACGNGAFSTELAPHCKTVVGVDISQGMVDAYNSRVQGLGITNTRALHAELQPDEPLLAGQKFDVIFCAHSYKHIEDNVAITRVLKSYLKSNGVLLVVDVMRGKTAIQVVADMKALHQHVSTPPMLSKNFMPRMNGYAEEDMRAIFEEAGLLDFTFEEAFEKEEDGKSFGLFLAKGVCPA